MIDPCDGLAVDADASAAWCTVNPHVLENLLRLAQRAPVSAVCDVVDAHGTVVLRRGEALSRAQHAVLAGRRLRQPLEACLESAASPTLAAIVEDARDLMRTTPALAPLGEGPGAGRALAALAGKTLAAPLALLLGVVRQTRRGRYDNSLAALLVGAALAAGLKLADGDGELLMLAALSRDIGEVCIDPALLESGAALPPARWEAATAHPLLGAALLAALVPAAPQLADCIAQHHERQDGGGYPRARRAATMTPLGTLLGLADCVAALVTGSASPGEPPRAQQPYAALRERVAITLGFVADEYPAPAVAVVNTALAPLAAHGEATGRTYEQSILPTLQRMRAARLCAEALARRSPHAQISACAEAARSALLVLDRRVRTTGVYELAQRERLENDAQRLAQACLVVDEAAWRMRLLARGVLLRAARYGVGDDAALAELVAALDAHA